MAEQPKHQGKKKSDPLPHIGGKATEMSLDFSRPPMSHGIDLPDQDDKGEFSQEEPLQAMQQIDSLKYRNAENPNHRLHMWLGIVGFFALLVGIPYYLIRTDSAINQKVKHSIRLMQNIFDKNGLGIHTKAFTEAMLLHLKSLKSPGTEKAAARAWRDMDCRFLVQEALSRRFRGTLEPTGKYLLMSCQVYQDSPKAALRFVAENYGDTTQFQQKSASWDMLPLQLITAEAQHRLAAFQRVAPKTFAACRRWNTSPSCLLKFLDLVRQPVRTRLDDGYGILTEALRTQSPVLQAWLNLGAGWNAIKSGDGAQAEKYLRIAARLFPELYDPFLEREIFRTRLSNAHRLMDKNLFGLIWKSRPTPLMNEDEAGFLDVQLYRTFIQNPDKIGEALDEFLSRPESYQRFRFDPEFVRMIVEQAIRQKKAEVALAYVDQIAELQDQEKTLGGEQLPLLRARLLLANLNGLEALQSLQTVERLMLKSDELAHLKGLAMLQAYSTKPYILLAAAEFQKAVNLEPRSEHLFALIVAFLETKDLKKAESTLNFWRKTKARPGDEAWRVLARGLILYGKGNESEARRIWQEMAERNPGFEVLQRLETNLKEDPKYMQDQLVKKLLQVLPIDGPLSPLVAF